MKSSDHGYFAALTHDLRVRERLINAGIVAQADIDRYLTELPELETQAEPLGIMQPALGTVGLSPSTVSTSVSTSTADADDDEQANEEGSA